MKKVALASAFVLFMFAFTIVPILANSPKQIPVKITKSTQLLTEESCIVISNPNKTKIGEIKWLKLQRLSRSKKALKIVEKAELFQKQFDSSIKKQSTSK